MPNPAGLLFAMDTGFPGQILLPEGFGFPPLPYLLGIIVGLIGIVAGLYYRRPRVSEALILGFAPWMAVGSALHVQYVVGSLPRVIEPLAGTPTVYLAIGILAGAIWLASDVYEKHITATSTATRRTEAILGITGTVVLIPAIGMTLAIGIRVDSLNVFWPLVGVLLAFPVTAGAWWLLTRSKYVVEHTGRVGLLVLFSHALDSISTAIGIDVLGFGERTPLSQLIIDVGTALPTADLLGVGWLFVVVKLAVVAFIVILFDEYVVEAPAEGYLLLGLVAAVGLGPGVHNLLLFAITGG